MRLREEIYHSPLPELDLHRISLLYIIHALGHFLDSDRSMYAAEGWYSYDLARAALSIKPVLDQPSISSIQSMVSNYEGVRAKVNIISLVLDVLLSLVRK